MTFKISQIDSCKEGKLRDNRRRQTLLAQKVRAKDLHPALKESFLSGKEALLRQKESLPTQKV